MSQHPVVEYTLIKSLPELHQAIVKHKLYLEKGLMLEHLLRAYKDYPDDSFGYLATVGGVVMGVGVFAATGDKEGNGMFFVKPAGRGKGIAKELVKHVMATTDLTVFVYPWEKKSIRFFRGLVKTGILSIKNFKPYEAHLIGSNAAFLTGQLHTECRRAEREVVSKSA